jgi:hypothetical protein
LTGRIFDDRGNRMSPSHVRKGGPQVPILPVLRPFPWRSRIGAPSAGSRHRGASSGRFASISYHPKRLTTGAWSTLTSRESRSSRNNWSIRLAETRRSDRHKAGSRRAASDRCDQGAIFRTSAAGDIPSSTRIARRRLDIVFCQETLRAAFVASMNLSPRKRQPRTASPSESDAASVNMSSGLLRSSSAAVAPFRKDAASCCRSRSRKKLFDQDPGV